MTQIETAVHDLLVKNRRTVGGYQFTLPSPGTYPYQWFWDSCFHAILLSYFDPEAAKKELLSVVAKQFESGMIPHMTYWQRGEAFNIDWGRPDTSALTQPPMLAYAVSAVYKKTGDKEFLRVLYPNLYHFYNYLLTERDPRKHHLAGIINPDESGEDNSPRFDAALDLPPRHTLEESTKRRMRLIEDNRRCGFDAPFCMKNFFWVKDVPFNSILAENLKIMSELASAIGFEDDRLRFADENLLVINAMRERMLEDGLFWSTHGKDYKKIKVKTWAIFAPLFAGIPSRDEANMLVREHLRNPNEFWTPYPVPTVAKNELSYDPKGFWRGPVWIATNWFIYKGLLNYGFREEAKKIKESSLALLEKSGFREHFDPETGEGLGASDFTWGGLVLDMTEPQV